MDQASNKAENGEVADENGKDLEERNFAIVFRVFTDFKNGLNGQDVKDVYGEPTHHEIGAKHFVVGF